jgi:hypothetical protein
MSFASKQSTQVRDFVPTPGFCDPERIGPPKQRMHLSRLKPVVKVHFPHGSLLLPGERADDNEEAH